MKSCFYSHSTREKCCQNEYNQLRRSWSPSEQQPTGKIQICWTQLTLNRLKEILPLCRAPHCHNCWAGLSKLPVIQHQQNPQWLLLPRHPSPATVSVQPPPRLLPMCTASGSLCHLSPWVWWDADVSAHRRRTCFKINMMMSIEIWHTCTNDVH